jgi:hypothetical protein
MSRLILILNLQEDGLHEGKGDVLLFVFLIEYNLTSNRGQYDEHIHFYYVCVSHSGHSEY